MMASLVMAGCCAAFCFTQPFNTLLKSVKTVLTVPTGRKIP